MKNRIINKSIMLKEIHEQPDRIRDALRKNLPEIKTAAYKIKQLKPKMINFAARGSSEHACITAKYLFEVFAGIPSTIISPSVITAYNAKLQLENSVTIGVSQCGQALDVVEVMNRTNEQGGITISITNTKDSPVETCAAHKLSCEAGQEICVTATKSYITQLTLLTALAAYVSEDEYLLSVLDKIADAADAALAFESDVEQMVNYYHFIDHLFVIARGYSYGVVSEAELKIQETCYIKAMAYSSADYTHGPFSLSNFNSPYIFMAIDKNTDKDVESLYKRIVEKYTFCACITNKQSVSEQFPLSILLPSWCEGVLGCFASAVIFQMFASYLSVSLGHNPDAPEGVSKVTITR